MRQNITIPVHVVEWRCHDLETRLDPFTTQAFGRPSYFGHHATPRDDISYTSRARPLLKIYNRLEKAIKMVVCGVIELLKSVEALR